MSFRDEYPSDLYDQSSIPGYYTDGNENTEGWQADTGSHIEIWNEGVSSSSVPPPPTPSSPYVELQSHLGGHGLKQEFNMLPGTRMNFILRYKGRYEYDAYDNAFDLKVEGASELLVDGTPAAVTGNTRKHSFMEEDEWDKYVEWQYATVSITAETGGSGLTKITLSFVPETTTTSGANGQEEITYGGFVDLVPVEVSWQAIAGFDNVDDHIDPWNKPIHGKRIFPDFKDPDDTTIRHKLQLIVKTSPALVGKTVYVKAFDVDDSTSEEFDLNLEGTAAVIDTNGKAGGDNLPDYLDTQLGGQFWDEDTSAWVGPTMTGVVDANGETKFNFRVGMQPGNNYRVVASVDDESMYDGVQAWSSAAEKYLGPGDSQTGGASASPLLTVWRRLWVENDSMEAIPKDPQPNSYKRNDLSSDVANPVIQQATLNGPQTHTVFLIQPISDGSSFTNLEHGNIIVGNVNHPVTGAGVSLGDHLVSVAGDHASGAVGVSYRLYDDDGFGLNQDSLPRNNLVDDVIKRAYKSAFIEVADAKPWNNNDAVAFYRNHPPVVFSYSTGYSYGVLDDAFDAKLEGNEKLWCASIMVAYQPGAGDNDPNDETNVNQGATVGDSLGFSGKARVSIVYSEVIRDLIDKSLRNGSATIQEYEQRLRLTAAHEIGHQPLYGLGEEAHHDEDGLMVDGGHADMGAADTPFSAKSVKRFRKVHQWRQKEE
jgi:hypothetical protein